MSRGWCRVGGALVRRDKSFEFLEPVLHQYDLDERLVVSRDAFALQHEKAPIRSDMVIADAIGLHEVVAPEQLGGRRDRPVGVDADGQRFVMISVGLDGDLGVAPTNTTLILVENWFEELKRLAPGN